MNELSERTLMLIVRWIGGPLLISAGVLVVYVGASLPIVALVPFAIAGLGFIAIGLVFLRGLW